MRHTPEETKEVKPKVSHDKEINVPTKIPEKEEILGKTHVATENLVSTRIKGIGNNFSRDKETGSRQLNEKAAKNSVVIEDNRSQLHISKTKQRRVRQVIEVTTNLVSS